MKKIFYIFAALFTTIIYSSEKPFTSQSEEEIIQKISGLKKANTKKFDAEYFKAHTKCAADCPDCTERMKYTFEISLYIQELDRRKNIQKK